MTESPYGNDAPDGYRWAWIPNREVRLMNWEAVAPADAKRCRWTDHGVRCEQMSVARLNRAQRPWTNPPPRWWHYCAEHMFGRRIRNGIVETCILVPDCDPLSEQAFT